MKTPEVLKILKNDKSLPVEIPKSGAGAEAPVLYRS
jgi:hypothetical protein